MSKSIILKANTFQYPTKEERKIIRGIIPKIKRLRVDYKPVFVEILKNEPFESVVKNEDVYWWVNCVNNRLGKLTETYVNTKTHFLRLQENRAFESENHYTDEVLLDHYIEIFYYYYFSTRDVLAQLINVSEELENKENRIFLNAKFLDSISNKEIKNALTVFLNKTKDSYDIRNAFNHRFTPTHMDNRAKKNVIKENESINFFYPTKINDEVFIDDIDSLMKQLSDLMNILYLEIK